MLNVGKQGKAHDKIIASSLQSRETLQQHTVQYALLKKGTTHFNALHVVLFDIHTYAHHSYK